MILEKILVVLIVLTVLSLVTWWTQRKGKPKVRRMGTDKNSRLSDLNLLYDRAKKEFISLEVRKFTDKVVISEKSLFNKNPKDLVFITLNPNRGKSVSKKGLFVVARYPHVPTREEMQKDFARVLNKY
ncbi:hypothetical protein [Acinetobacter guerrae]|uniref:hypothetical protein n=1 Tax=Acinetobacter guerrae TaxID=1843371 RepID=UPI00128B5884|nr:hypothetical protein [Acinetobacter guerrae]MPW45797.1 hypothetical protein [Acinetobacter guerrae]